MKISLYTIWAGYILSGSEGDGTAKEKPATLRWGEKKKGMEREKKICILNVLIKCIRIATRVARC